MRLPVTLAILLRRLAPVSTLLALASPGQAPTSGADLKLNQIQVIGTHNSYHAGLAPSEATLMKQQNPGAFAGLDYRHQGLTQQFDAGVRQIEIDIFADSKGGLYAHPYGPQAVARAQLPPDPPFDPQGLFARPGFKVFHVQDYDVRSSCQPFTGCLSEVRVWSKSHPDHIPIFILIETKQGKPASRPEMTEPERFTPAVFDALDAEIRSVFSPDEIITPDQVRGSYPTLNAAVRAGNWPSLASSRGKVVFLMDQHPMTPVYTEGHPSLRGRILFTNSDPGAPDAAFLERNDGPASEITELVRQGYLVRTRTDADTHEARTNSTTRRDAMMASGAQILSTDYPASEPAQWPGHYTVALPGGSVWRCNAIATSESLASCPDKKASTK